MPAISAADPSKREIPRLLRVHLVRMFTRGFRAIRLPELMPRASPDALLNVGIDTVPPIEPRSSKSEVGASSP